MMKKRNITTFIFLVSTIFCAQVFAYDCALVEDKEYYSVGDSDFQYHYNFKKDGKASLIIYFEELDMQDNETITTESYEGSYKVKEDKLMLDIEVRKTKHAITFECQNKVNYMNRGPYDKALVPTKRSPEHHSFSGVPLFRKGSKVIRSYLKKH